MPDPEGQATAWVDLSIVDGVLRTDCTLTLRDSGVPSTEAFALEVVGLHFVDDAGRVDEASTLLIEANCERDTSGQGYTRYLCRSTPEFGPRMDTDSPKVMMDYEAGFLLTVLDAETT